MELFNENNLKSLIQSNINDTMLKLKISTNNQPEWLNVKQAARYMCVSDTTFRTWRKKYKIPSRTIGNITRWKRSDLDKFWKDHGVKGYL